MARARERSKAKAKARTKVTICLWRSARNVLPSSRAVPIVKRTVLVDIGPETTRVPRMLVHRRERRAYLTIGSETFGFDLALTSDHMSTDATALVAHARLDASDIPIETPPKAPPGTRRPRKPPRVIPLLEDVKNTVVEARAQRLNVSLVWIADSSPLGKETTEDPAMCPHVETDTRVCDTLAKRV